MFVQGFSATFIASTQVKLLGEWFSPNELSVCIGVYMAVTAGGMAIGTGTTGMLPSVKFAYTVAAVIGTCVAVIWLLFMKEKRVGHPGGQEEKKSVIRALKIVFKERNMIIACSAVLCAQGCYMVISSFLPAILQEVKGMSLIDAGSAASMVSVGYLAGCLMVPAIAAKIGKYRPIVIALAVMGTAFVMLINFTKPGIPLTILLALTGYVIGGTKPFFLSLPIRLRSIGVENAGTAGGLLNTFQLGGAVIIPSYVVLPISGGDYTKLLPIGAGIYAIVCAAAFLMSKSAENA
jgi:NNP family nitrate/nitrite transporter-like MFS transporter